MLKVVLVCGLMESTATAPPCHALLGTCTVHGEWMAVV